MKKEYNFEVIYSEEDEEYIGLCKEFPSLSYLDVDCVRAYLGILDIVFYSTIDLKCLGDIKINTSKDTKTLLSKHPFLKGLTEYSYRFYTDKYSE